MTVAPSAPSSASLHMQAAERLRNMLVEGEIAPGAKLNERALSEQLLVSRTPLREAIKMLASEGLVELLPNRGAVAVSLSARDVHDTFEVMAGLESMAGDWAAQRITPSQLAHIQDLHAQMLVAHSRRELPPYYRLNAQIHAAISVAAANPVLHATYAQVNARLQALRFKSNQDDAKWQRAVHEHVRMVHALEARDSAAMRAVMLEHLNHKRDVVMALLQAPNRS